MRTITVRLFEVQRLPNGRFGGPRYQLWTDAGVFRTKVGAVIGFGSMSALPVRVDQVVDLDRSLTGKVIAVGKVPRNVGSTTPWGGGAN
jgi:hypothetical protein